MVTLVQVLRKAQTTRGRFALAVAVTLPLLLAALTIRLGPGTERAASNLLQETVFLLVVPVVALVFAVASLGDLVDDGTLVYLWLRPVARWRLALAGVLASAQVAVPVTVVATTAVALVAGGIDLVVPAGLAAALGTIAYASIFAALGLRTTRSLLWGLLYVLMLEGFLARFSDQLAAVSIRRYLTSVYSQLAGVSNRFQEVELTTAVVMLVVLTGVGVALGTWWLERRDVP